MDVIDLLQVDDDVVRHRAETVAFVVVTAAQCVDHLVELDCASHYVLDVHGVLHVDNHSKCVTYAGAVQAGESVEVERIASVTGTVHVRGRVARVSDTHGRWQA